MSVTLILTRNPLRSFNHGRQSGRWGELVAIKGPKINSVTMSMTGGGGIPVDFGSLALSTSGGSIGDVKRYTTIERFKTNSGKGFYVELHPKPGPYWVTYEIGNSAVRELRKGHDGRCFRVHGGKSGPEQGILIHEAPHVGWVIGCISPRPLHNYALEFSNAPGNPSYNAMNELFHFVGCAPADFFVVDW